ncbi:zinc finger protein 239-like [Ctenocephalides felis]|uniref:zinc finger protein 239-like n=1 Tax=Ctenocephalides felis TaxID=7515 RepID=UPI000E6E253D|nr:zinc finger protein 239-like [Ctenocephalides felis]
MTSSSKVTSQSIKFSRHVSSSSGHDSDQQHHQGPPIHPNFTLMTSGGSILIFSSFVKTAGRLKIHLRTHTGEKGYQCNLCSREFNRLNHFEATHAYSQWNCANLFESEIYLEEEDDVILIKAVRNKVRKGSKVPKIPRKKSYICTYCPKVFTRKDSLSSHIRTHTGERPYKCDECNKAFASSVRLTMHKRIHTGDRRYECHFCDKKFTQISILTRHKVIHTGERPFKCKYCDKAYTQPGPLSTHTRTHTGEKRYKCLTCSKMFTTSNALVVHTRLHTGERPYKCTVCGKGFTQSPLLQRHMKTHNIV